MSTAVVLKKNTNLASNSLVFDPRKARNFKFFPGSGIRRDGGAGPQSLDSVPYITGLNPKSLHSEILVRLSVLSSASQLQ